MSRSLTILAGTAVLATALPLLSTSAHAAPEGSSFHRVATFPVFQNAPAGTAASAATVAEISDVSDDGRTLVYTDAAGKRIGFLDISDPAHPRGDGSLSLEELGDADDQPTSVSVVGPYVLVVVDTSAAFTEPSGRLDVVRLSDGTRVRSIDLGGQPDSIAVTRDDTLAAVAIENQRDEDATPAGGAKGDLPQAPGGFVQLIDLEASPATWDTRRVDLDPAVLQEAGIVAPTDPEPEYVSFNSRGTLAVTLQENNGVVLIDGPTGRVEKAFSAGTVSLTGIDAKKDGAISLTDSLTDVRREPDAIAWIGDDHVATANEGDWKGGSRGWTVFDTDGDVVWDAGSSFERLAVRHGLHNDDRAAKKGAEPEGLAVAEFDGKPYAFVGSERSNFVAVYDVSDPASPRFVQVMPTTNGPEGLLPIPSRGLFAVSSETDDASVGVRATVGLYQWKPGRSAFPSIVSDDRDGAPIGWQALGALSADPEDASTLWTAADTVIKNGTLYRVDVSAAPARITESLAVTEGGAPAALDIEGIFKRPQGGFWLASEGATGPGNVLVRTDDAGVVQERVSLPEDITARLGKWGLEGVTATTDADGEHVWFALQRPLTGEDLVRIGRYDVADGSFAWYGYELESPLRGSGDWVGLSEITAIDHDTFAVIERDKLNGPQARNKRVYTFTVPADSTEELPVLDKRLAIDVLPALRATNGWTQEKLEGFTIAADGRLYGVTDNDGLKEATGETVFLRLGTAAEAFGEELATTTGLRVSRRQASYGQRLTATVSLGGAAAAGTVRLKDGRTVVATARVEKGAATVTLPRLAPGTHRLTAEFSGGPLAAPSVSAPITVRVVRATSRTTATAASSVKRGRPVRLTARVRSAGHVPTGKVRFMVGGRVLATAKLRDGRATTSVRFRQRGMKPVRAVYVGSTTTKGSASTPARVRVR
ncbi:esterase-like activity of phytase family protein [Aeromicrobium sp. 179-A 4D2 NHS]|uniref:esterase-like activity of phytase family protein n=1 Tax=Aeromicrobium sp. 179-A 4D2 NHS TaxID=3142375 RepID=UPI0039A2C4A4